MRTAVIMISDVEDKRLREISLALTRGIGSQGQDATLIDGRLDSNVKLTSFDYLAVGTVSPSLFAGKVSPSVAAFLKSCGHIAGKRCYAFVTKKGLRSPRVLHSLMKVMEGEGCLLKKSDILSSPGEAEAMGRRLHLTKAVKA